jgi:hypothetical protein
MAEAAIRVDLVLTNQNPWRLVAEELDVDSNGPWNERQSGG